LVCGIGAIILSILATTSCDFMNVSYDEDTVPDKLPYNDTLDFNIGLFRFEPDNEGCQGYPDELNALDVELTTARIAALVGIVCALVGFALLWIEVVCCRFCGARFLQGSCFFVAAVSQGCTFLLFGSLIWYVECQAGLQNVNIVNTISFSCPTNFYILKHG